MFKQGVHLDFNVSVSAIGNSNLLPYVCERILESVAIQWPVDIMIGPGRHPFFQVSCGVTLTIGGKKFVARGPFHKAGSTTSESNPKRWVDLL